MSSTLPVTFNYFVHDLVEQQISRQVILRPFQEAPLFLLFIVGAKMKRGEIVIGWSCWINIFKTSIHSSRMRTVRSSGRLLGGEVCPGGMVSAGGGGCLPRVVSAWGVCIPACTWADPLSVGRMTDRCKNITFPQLRLRTVKRNYPRLCSMAL